MVRRARPGQRAVQGALRGARRARPARARRSRGTALTSARPTRWDRLCGALASRDVDADPGQLRACGRRGRPPVRPRSSRGTPRASGSWRPAGSPFASTAKPSEPSHHYPRPAPAARARGPPPPTPTSLISRRVPPRCGCSGTVPRPWSPASPLDESNADDGGANCRALDGMPLAIELAAVSSPARCPRRSSPNAWTTGSRCSPAAAGRRCPRHQTLRAVVDWSWNLLSEPERVLARRLSVFPVGWG